MPKRRTRKRRRQAPPPPYPVPPYQQLAVTTMTDTAVDQHQLPAGHRPREVIVADLLDRYGRHCRRFNDEPAVLLDRPTGGAEA